MSVDDLVGEGAVVDGETVPTAGASRQPAGDGSGRSQPGSGRASSPRAWASVAGSWAASAAIGAVIVAYLISPLFAQRDQHRLLVAYRGILRQSSLEATGLFGVTLPTKPPPTGSTVGVLQIGRLNLEEAVVEGVGPAQTERGPGHVPGTAGLGQPGNAAVVGRHAAFGGAFRTLPSLRRGDPIVVTTTEGQTLYVVSLVRSLSLGPAAATDGLYGLTADNRLTLVTSRSDVPWARSAATVVVATMRTTPFAPTPQQARSEGEDGRSGASGGWAPFVLALQAFAVVATGAVALYRRGPLRSAYLLSTAPLVVVTVLVAVAGFRLLPAWT